MAQMMTIYGSDPDHASSVDNTDDESRREEYLKVIFSLISQSFNLMK
jgi:hypothetical protein